MVARDNPLRKMSDSIQALADTVNSANPHIKVSDVVQLCRLNYTSLSYLGIAIKFTDLELQSKVDNLVETSKKYDTIKTLVETEIKNGFAKDNSSHCRNLVRLKRVINLVREAMERLLEHGWYVKPWTKFIYIYI
ncbi:accelerated cell death 11 [Quercus suber]|uniref:Accelerated cell death 11 n=1 Tax=Quercus suber TaxID=58331 RepID=A0AAW0MDJ9_QUESU